MTEKEFMFVYRYLGSMIPDLPDMLRLELMEIHDEIKGWTTARQRGIVDSVDWDGYAQHINNILEAEGMDPLFTFVEVTGAMNN